MIAVVVIAAPSPEMLGLSERQSVSLLPLGDRPLLQHLIEYLVLQGILRFELILAQAPEQIEAYLGNGVRWGCAIRYHLATELERPYRSLQVIPALRDQQWLLVHSNQFPYVAFEPHLQEAPAIFLVADERAVASDSRWRWSGMALFPAKFPISQMSRLSPTDLDGFLSGMESSGNAKGVLVRQCVDGSTPAGLLNTQRLLLDGEFPDFLMSGVEEKPGIRVSRNVVLHPSVQLIAPAYLGPHCRVERGARIGPHAVVSGNCVVDAQTVIRDSLVNSGSYIGQHLELDGVIVDRSLLVNARLGTEVVIRDHFLLSGLEGSTNRGMLRRMEEAMLAVFLIAAFSPFLVALFMWALFSTKARFSHQTMVELPAPADSESWRTYLLPLIEMEFGNCSEAHGWPSFIFRFLPGLFAVARGRLGFVGLPPRTREEVLQLSADWRSLYLNGHAGLITEASVMSNAPAGETEAYVAEACYMATASWAHELSLVQKYFRKLLTWSRSNVDDCRTAEPSAE